MADATVRVSGVVLNVDNRRGTTRPRDGEPGRPYSIDTVRVLVEETGIADVTIPDSMMIPTRGEPVDLVADVSTFQGRVQLRALRSLSAV